VALHGWLGWWGFWTQRDRWFAAWEFDAFSGEKKWVYSHGPMRLTDDEALAKYLDVQETYWNGKTFMWSKHGAHWKLDQGAEHDQLGVLPLLALPWITRKATEAGEELGERIRAITGSAPAKYPPAAQVAFCRVDPSSPTQLTTIVQGYLLSKGASIPKESIGRGWDAATCKAWWNVMKEPVTAGALRRILPDLLKPCPTMTVSVQCPKPFPWLPVGAAAAVLGASVVYYRRARS